VADSTGSICSHQLNRIALTACVRAVVFALVSNYWALGWSGGPLPLEPGGDDAKDATPVPPCGCTEPID
jgi:hypothetical protein